MNALATVLKALAPGLALFALSTVPLRAADSAALPSPSFHHLHLNSVNPDAAIGFYVREFSGTGKGEWNGIPALTSPNNVMVLFNRVARPPLVEPEATAFWHFGWHVTDERKAYALYSSRPEVKLMPLYTTEEGDSVLVSSDT